MDENSITSAHIRKGLILVNFFFLNKALLKLRQRRPDLIYYSIIYYKEGVMEIPWLVGLPLSSIYYESLSPSFSPFQLNFKPINKGLKIFS